MTSRQPFSSRHSYSGGAKEITVREDAPEDLRYFVLETARDLTFGPKLLRPVLCRVLRRKPNEDNWSEYPNLWLEVQQLMYGCDWFRVYDVIEALYADITVRDHVYQQEHGPQFRALMNGFFVEEGIGWQLTVGGEIVSRGDEAFETIVTGSKSRLSASGRSTAAKHIAEALGCLSRRPEPNAPGAAYHAMGALECVARDVTGNAQATLGQILKRYPGLLPKPLDAALSQIWG
jgi:hypothetical protein